jgi:hypothetical protein
MPEQEPNVMPIGGFPEPGAAELHEETIRTIAVRVPEDVHTRLSFVAQLRDSTITGEVRAAIDSWITAAQDDPDVLARAQEAREAIEREAAARSAAIAGFMGTAALAGAADSTPKSRRGGTNAKPASE